MGDFVSQRKSIGKQLSLFDNLPSAQKILLINFGVGKLVYDINLNYLGVRSQSSGVRREERRTKE